MRAVGSIERYRFGPFELQPDKRRSSSASDAEVVPDHPTFAGVVRPLGAPARSLTPYPPRLGHAVSAEGRRCEAHA